MFTWKYTKLSTGSKTNHDNCLIPPLSLPLSQSLHLKVKQDYTSPVNMKQEVHTARTASRCNCGKDYSRKRFKPWWRYVGFKKKSQELKFQILKRFPFHSTSHPLISWFGNQTWSVDKLWFNLQGNLREYLCPPHSPITENICCFPSQNQFSPHTRNRPYISF